ncbi:mitochondrial import receptor subunit TOM20-like protein, partial [Tanacetum coccineum]
MSLQNLTIWGASLLELSQYGTIDDSRKMLRDYKWILTSNYDEAKMMFDEAVQCFEKAVDESPDNEDYRKSLAGCAKVPALHRGIYGVLDGSSNAMDMNAPNLERCMLFEHMNTERDYLKNPTDTD